MARLLDRATAFMRAQPLDAPPLEKLRYPLRWALLQHLQARRRCCCRRVQLCVTR